MRPGFDTEETIQSLNSEIISTRNIVLQRNEMVVQELPFNIFWVTIKCYNYASHTIVGM